MDWVFVPKGFLLGLSVAAPVGPIGILTIRRTLNDGLKTGLATGLGAATADAAYGMIAAFGLTAVMSALVDHSDAVRLAGGLMLLYLGLRGLMHARSRGTNGEQLSGGKISARASYVQTIGLTLTNPMTILSFVGMFAGVGIVKSGANLATSVGLVLGVGLGSADWWLFLTGLTTTLRSRLPDNALSVINIASSLIITGFGVAALITAR